MMHSVRTVEAALPFIEKSDAGSILVISSVSGLEFDFTSPAYGTFKAALIHYASRLASTLAAKHIRVNTVSPGNICFEGGIWQKIERNVRECPSPTLPHFVGAGEELRGNRSSCLRR
jgi:3-oxoacyl-[acyl-carrier protein] reductase